MDLFVDDAINRIKQRNHPPVHTPEDDIKDGQYSFDAEGIGDAFEKIVISNQIPGYGDLRNVVSTLVANELIAANDERGKSRILDLGAGSGGDIINTLLQIVFGMPDFSRFYERNPFSIIGGVEYFGIDDSRELSQTREQRLELLIELMRTEAVEQDEPFRSPLIDGDMVDIIDYFGEHEEPKVCVYKDGKFDVVLANLLLQFLPHIDRPFIISNIHRNLRPGGVFVFVEKTVPNSLANTTLMRNMYHDEKRRNGMSERAIENKEETLHTGAFLNPLTVEGNLELLVNSGFERRDIDIFWKNLNFTMFVARKAV